MTEDEARQMSYDAPVVLTCFKGGPITGRWRGYERVFSWDTRKAVVLLDNPPEGHSDYCYTNPEWVEREE